MPAALWEKTKERRNVHIQKKQNNFECFRIMSGIARASKLEIINFILFPLWLLTLIPWNLRSYVSLPFMEIGGYLVNGHYALQAELEAKFKISSVFIQPLCRH